MYEVKEIEDSIYKVYELVDSSTNSWVKIAPERGGIIFSYGVHGQELLYLNEETFYNNEKNVRGGIPILFPISGQLTNGEYQWEGKTYSMKNHGFARNTAWEVVDHHADDRASLTIKLASNEETKASYPFDFEVIFTYVLENGKLTIHQEYKNTGNHPMPVATGFHPYFKTSTKELTYITDATKYFDYNDEKIKAFTGTLDLENLKESVVFIDAKAPEIAFNLSGLNPRVVLNYSELFKYVVLWTEKGNEFICVEPWMVKNEEFNRKEELVVIDGQDQLKLEFSIVLEKE